MRVDLQTTFFNDHLEQLLIGVLCDVIHIVDVIPLCVDGSSHCVNQGLELGVVDGQFCSFWVGIEVIRLETSRMGGSV